MDNRKKININMSKTIYDEIQSLGSNKEKVGKMIDHRLSPKYGLAANLTMLIVNIYVEVSGDRSMMGKYNCGNCIDLAWRKLNDFHNYGDNVGQPLINWESQPPLSLGEESFFGEEPPAESKPKRKEK